MKRTTGLDRFSVTNDCTLDPPKPQSNAAFCKAIARENMLGVNNPL